MVFMVLPAWILAMLPNLLGGMFKYATSQGEVNKMNVYNSPTMQLRRITGAGLPAAAFSGGQAGSQSSMPDLSGFDGSSYWQNYQQIKQQQLLKEQIRKMGADADIQEMLADVQRERNDYDLNHGEVVGGVARSYAWLSKQREYQMAEAAQDLQKNQKAISDVDRRIKEANEPIEKKKAHAELDRLLLGLNMGNLQMENERIRTLARNSIIKRMEKGGLNLFEAIFLVVMGSIGGGVKSDNYNIGF